MPTKRYTYKLWDIPFEQVLLIFRDIHSLNTQFVDLYKIFSGNT